MGRPFSGVSIKIKDPATGLPVEDGQEGEICVNGCNVSTREVEAFIETHPEVKEAHMIGAPDPIKQEMGLVFVRTTPGSACTAQDIIDYCRGKIASFKIPRYIRFRDEFPLTGSGKVKKYVLKEAILKELNL